MTVTSNQCYFKTLFHLVPSQPSNVTVETGGLLQALVVDWDVPQRPAGVIASYMVNYNGTTLTTGGNITILTITGLDPFTLYSITVTACTVDGCGNQTNPFLGTTAEEGSYVNTLIYCSHHIILCKEYVIPKGTWKIT